MVETCITRHAETFIAHALGWVHSMTCLDTDGFIVLALVWYWHLSSKWGNGGQGCADYVRHCTTCSTPYVEGEGSE